MPGDLRLFADDQVRVARRIRNFDDKVISDIIVLKRDGGELTTVTLDEFSVRSGPELPGD